ncbi:hypothetical protein A9G06_10450 [Aeromonas sp. DNP9]|nr:hypothetical protein A9G06_10450 [Aeromonas sp. DNP9]
MVHQKQKLSHYQHQKYHFLMYMKTITISSMSYQMKSLFWSVEKDVAKVHSLNIPIAYLKIMQTCFVHLYAKIP